MRQFLATDNYLLRRSLDSFLFLTIFRIHSNTFAHCCLLSMLRLIVMLHESDFHTDNRSNNKRDKKVPRKSCRLSAQLSARLPRMLLEIAHAQRLIDQYLLTRSDWLTYIYSFKWARLQSVASAVTLKCKRIAECKLQAPAAEMRKLVTGCRKWHAPVARWTEHAYTLHNHLSTVGSKLVDRRSIHHICK